MQVFLYLVCSDLTMSVSTCTGEICPVGPTSFEFVVPEGVPMTVSPAVGTIQPGKVCVCVGV